MAPPSTPRAAPKPGAHRPRALAQPSPWPQAPVREQQREAKRNAVDQLGACMQVYADIVTQPFGMCIIRIGDEEVPEPSRTELRRMKSEIDQAFRRLVAQGVQEGTLAPCDPKMTAFVIAGALSWIGRWYQSGGEYSAAQVAEQCIGTLMHGVLGPGRVAAAGR